MEKLKLQDPKSFWFPSEGHICQLCNHEVACPKCGALKVKNLGYDVYLCLDCHYSLEHLSESGSCKTL
ncbi:hypothetical protein [[Eubacterium] cellulosolvens]